MDLIIPPVETPDDSLSGKECLAVLFKAFFRHFSKLIRLNNIFIVFIHWC